MANNPTSDKIESVINEHIVTMDGHRDGDILVEWAVICFVTNQDEEKGDAYPIVFSNGRMPTYRARGLFHTALKGLDDSTIYPE
jgi:hypothetical protein